LNVHGVNVRQNEIHAAEAVVSEPSVFKVEMAMKKLKRHKSPGTDQIRAEMIKAGDRTILRAILLLGIRRNCLSSGRSQSFYLFIQRVRHITISPTHKILSNILLSRLTLYAKEISWDNQSGF
jgi:hypothetical protein